MNDLDHDQNKESRKIGYDGVLFISLMVNIMALYVLRDGEFDLGETLVFISISIQILGFGWVMIEEEGDPKW